MLIAVVALVASQALLAALLFGTAALDRSAAAHALFERHPLLPRGWRQRRALDAHRRRLARLGAATERARAAMQ